MKIVFDCRYTRITRHDGISRYTAGLVTALAEQHPVTMLISDKRQLALLPDLPYAMASSPTSPRELFVARQVNKLHPDVVFTPMQTMGTIGRTYPLALTVHDLIYYSNPTPPREFAWPLRLLWRLYHTAWWPQRLLLNRADAVVTVSHTTRALVEQHHLTSKPIVVVSNAADAPEPQAAAATADAAKAQAGAPAATGDAPDLQAGATAATGDAPDAQAADPQAGTPDPHAATPAAPDPHARSAAKSLVYMGSFMPYKNVETLIEAMPGLPGYTLHLMSAVRDANRERLQALAPDARLHFHNGATDAEYHEVLDGATALVTASLEEGFGIPLVESMGRGTPVVVSDIPVFREIGGEAALYFDAKNPHALAHAVQKLEDPKEWFRRSLASKDQAETFSWAASATALLALLEELAGSRARR